jgi:hypothetical protein
MTNLLANEQQLLVINKINTQRFEVEIPDQNQDLDKSLLMAQKDFENSG